jgi:hypothetical protein
MPLLNKNSIVASTISHKSYPKTAFDSILLLTDKATFAEDFRVYQDSVGFLEDNTDQALQDVGLLLFAQQPRLITVIVAKVDSLIADVGALSSDMVALDSTLDTDFFAVCVVSDHTDAQLVELAKFAETQEMLCSLYTNNPEALTTVTTDLASLVQALNLSHTFVWYHATIRLDMAFLSRFLGEKIGLVSAKHLVLAGVTPSNLSTTAMGNLLNKDCNVYDSERKKYIFTKQGTTASGEHIKSKAGEIFVSVTCIEALYELQLNNSLLSFNKIDLKRVSSTLMFELKKAQAQKIIAEDDPDIGSSILMTLNPLRAESTLEVEVKYLDAGTMKFITIKFTAYKDDNQFNIERTL